MRQPNEFGDAYIVNAFITQYERCVVVLGVRAHPNTPLCDPLCVKLSVDDCKVTHHVYGEDQHNPDHNPVFLLYHDEARRVSACAQTLALTTPDERPVAANAEDNPTTFLEGRRLHRTL